MPPSNTSKVPAGTVLASKYRITKEIGRGGMAAVYEAEHIEIGKRVAVKILAAELVNSRVVLGRFLREARATAAIRSPYICDVYDSGEWGDRPFLVMELLEGESLYELLSRERRLSVDQALRIATQTAKGLMKAHGAGVVHRDLKPENIFMALTEEGDTVAKILDFGLAKFYEPANEGGEATRLTREGALFGTPAYMAPEQAKGQGEVDHRCDLWALGCIVYECLTGRTVWNSDQGVAMILAQIAGAPIPRPSRLRPDLPGGFDDWFLKALERDANRRFQSAKEFAIALERALKPVPGALKRATLHSEEEGQVVDALVDPLQPDSWDGIAGQRPSLAQPSSATGEEALAPVVPEPKVAPPPAARSSGSEKAVAVLLLVTAVAIGGYVFWLYVVHPPEPTAAAPLPTSSTPTAPSETAPQPLAATPTEPLEAAPYALQIASAQQLLNSDKHAESLAMFREAFNAGGTRVARGLLNQAGTALRPEKGRCRLTGLSRPRPYDNTARPSRTTAAVSDTGTLFVWVDNHEDSRRRQAFGVLLDGALRRVTPARGLTPEAESAGQPQLIPAGDRLALLYSDSQGKDPGIYARLVERDGRIAGPARRISKPTQGEVSSSLARLADGTFWAVWQENEQGDLIARHLDAELKPLAEAVQLTRFGRTDQSARRPALDVAHGRLHIAFELGKPRMSSINVLTIALDDPQLKRGVEGAEKDVKHVGTLHRASAQEGRHAEPRIACTEGGCYVVWDDEKAGAMAAYYASSSSEPIWRREIAALGNRPSAISNGKEIAVAWFELKNKRVMFARITPDGIEEPSVIGRMSAFQPYPDLVATPDAWFVAWRDFEAGKLEGYLVRVVCSEAP
ncbi:MAG: protein kinase [Polyangiaceae bacterium]|nr:protein kinase [Polyangiaceae bacterium]MCW5790603.1 protein kinase [Polyangiaceae bacterium]